MNNKTEGTLSAIAALLVLFTTMLNPWISVALAVSMFIVIAIYRFSGKNMKNYEN